MYHCNDTWHNNIMKRQFVTSLQMFFCNRKSIEERPPILHERVPERKPQSTRKQFLTCSQCDTVLGRLDVLLGHHLLMNSQSAIPTNPSTAQCFNTKSVRLVNSKGQSVNTVSVCWHFVKAAKFQTRLPKHFSSTYILKANCAAE